MNNVRVRALLVGAWLAVVATVGACGGGDTASGPSEEPPPDPNTPAVGTFVLSTVDGKALPGHVVADSFYTLDITAGGAVFDSAGTFTVAITTRETVAGVASTYVDTTRGTWTQVVGAVTLTMAPDNATATASWTGRTLSLGVEIGPVPNTLVFTRTR